MVSQEIRAAVTAALGYEVDDERIESAMTDHATTTTSTLQRTLQQKEALFGDTGGRGVNLADEIDTLRLILATRKEGGMSTVDANTLPRLQATFRPQQWQNDYAVDSDGQRTFDATDALLALDAETIRGFRFNHDDSDFLAQYLGIGREHDGPFEVDVDEGAFHHFFAVNGLDSVSLTEEQLASLRQKYGWKPRPEVRQVEYYRLWDNHTWDTDFLAIPFDTSEERLDEAVRASSARLPRREGPPVLTGFYSEANDVDEEAG